MAFDIYGNVLSRGCCEVHPHVHEEYPCHVCIADRRIDDRQQERDELGELKYHYSQACDHIRITDQKLRDISELVENTALWSSLQTILNRADPPEDM